MATDVEIIYLPWNCQCLCVNNTVRVQYKIWLTIFYMRVARKIYKIPCNWLHTSLPEETHLKVNWLYLNWLHGILLPLTLLYDRKHFIIICYWKLKWFQGFVARAKQRQESIIDNFKFLLNRLCPNWIKYSSEFKWSWLRDQSDIVSHWASQWQTLTLWTGERGESPEKNEQVDIIQAHHLYLLMYLLVHHLGRSLG